MSQQHQQGGERGPLPDVPYAGALLRVGAMAALHPLDYAKTLIQVGWYKTEGKGSYLPAATKRKLISD